MRENTSSVVLRNPRFDHNEMNLGAVLITQPTASTSACNTSFPVVALEICINMYLLKQKWILKQAARRPFVTVAKQQGWRTASALPM